MGGSSSRFIENIDGVDSSERFFGLENFGNTCYCNSVLQALYSCKLFRRRLLDYVHSLPDDDVDYGLLEALANLFEEIERQPKQAGVLAPSKFIQTVKRLDERFRSYMHQDAQEFLNYTLDTLLETVTGIEKKLHPSSSESSSEQSSQSSAVGSTFIHHTFCGKTVTHTRCMNCEKESDREENFMELTLEIERPDTTLSRCLLAFSKKELLDADNKFFCGGCNSYQEAQKWVDIKQAPPVLIFHLNRLGFLHHLGRERKLKHRVVFDDHMKLPNMMQGCWNPSGEYSLFAVVAHVGTGPHHGHYVSYIKSGDKWICFDDNVVNIVSPETVQATYGKASDWSVGNDMHAYILFYQLAGASAPSLSPRAAHRGTSSSSNSAHVDD